MGLYTGTAILKNSLLVSYKTDYAITVWPNCIVGHSSPRNKNLYSPKNRYTIIQSRTSHNCQDRRWHRHSLVGDWLNILGVQLHQRIILSNKLLMHTPTWINFYVTFWVGNKKPIPKGYISYDSFIWHSWNYKLVVASVQGSEKRGGKKIGVVLTEQQEKSS